MEQSDLAAETELRKIIDDFLIERRDAKLEKLKPDDPKRGDVFAQYERRTWLADAARRVSQIQAATHTLKAVHPDARGTNLYCRSCTLPECALGSIRERHCWLGCRMMKIRSSPRFRLMTGRWLANGCNHFWA